jgi:hypothetical protein
MGFQIIGEIGAAEPEDEPVLESLIGIDPAKERIRILKGENQGAWLEHPDFISTVHSPGDPVKFWHIVAFEGAPDGNRLFELDGSGESICPGWTRLVGKGRVLVAPFYNIYPPDGQAATSPGFDDRSYLEEGLHWAAGRPMPKFDE